MEFEGIITFIGDEEQVGKNNLPKVTFVVEEETDREYKGSVAADLFNDKIDMIKNFKVGDKVKIGLNSRANEYNGRWYNRVNCWRIDASDGSNASSNQGGGNNADDDLPF